MRIGIDISQLAFEGTGVANFVLHTVDELLHTDTENEYVLFYSSMRKKLPELPFMQGKVKNLIIKQFKFPPLFLEFLWNRLHIIPIEWFIGPIDVFLSSDWVQPPAKAKKATILYDLIVYTYPDETHNRARFSFKNFLFLPDIVASQKRRLAWVKKEVDIIICISKSTKKDAQDILHIEEERLHVIYPGL